jgi:hypothetical protein
VPEIILFENMSEIRPRKNPAPGSFRETFALEVPTSTIYLGFAKRVIFLK